MSLRLVGVMGFVIGITLVGVIWRVVARFRSVGLKYCVASIGTVLVLEHRHILVGLYWQMILSLLMRDWWWFCDGRILLIFRFLS